MDSQWRHHFDGLTRMIELRGGMLAYYKEAPHMRASVAGLVMTEAFANSTTPYNDQFTRLTCASQLDAVRHVLGDGVYPAYIGTLCPPDLVLLIIQINHLRSDAAARTISALSPSNPAHDTQQESSSDPRALALLDRIQSFSPTRSAARAGLLSQEDWVLFGRIYQSATALYCVMALRAIGLFPSTPSSPTLTPTPTPSSSSFSQSTTPAPAAVEAAHYDRLLPDLKRALDARPQNKSPLLWPLAVAGARARDGSAFERGFVEDAVRGVGRHVGSVVPWAAAVALRRFWDGDGRRGGGGGVGEGWDDCWDRAYCLLG